MVMSVFALSFSDVAANQDGIVFVCSNDIGRWAFVQIEQNKIALPHSDLVVVGGGNATPCI